MHTIVGLVGLAVALIIYVAGDRATDNKNIAFRTQLVGCIIYILSGVIFAGANTTNIVIIVIFTSLWLVPTTLTYRARVRGEKRLSKTDD